MLYSQITQIQYIITEIYLQYIVICLFHYIERQYKLVFDHLDEDGGGSLDREELTHLQSKCLFVSMKILMG